MSFPLLLGPECSRFATVPISHTMHIHLSSSNSFIFHCLSGSSSRQWVYLNCVVRLGKEASGTGVVPHLCHEAAVPKVWDHHQHLLVTCQKCKLLALLQTYWNWKLWRWGLSILLFRQPCGWYQYALKLENHCRFGQHGEEQSQVIQARPPALWWWEWGVDVDHFMGSQVSGF